MPPCVQCGKETPRDQMYGYKDELRCRACVQKIGSIEERLNSPRAKERQPVATAVIAAAAVICTIAYGRDRGLVEFLISIPPKIWDGELWRLVSTVLPHGGLLHLVFNLYWMYQAGMVLEKWMGVGCYVAFFAVVGAGASATELLVFANPGIGLSGVGYGFFGFLFAIRKHKDFAAALMQKRLIETFVGWFFLCIALTITKIMPIANAAHAGGALLGWLFGIAYLSRQRIPAIISAGVFCLAICGATLYMPWNGEFAWHKAYKLASNGDIEAALPWYRQAMNSHPEDERLRESVEKMEQWVRENAAQPNKNKRSEESKPDGSTP